MASICLLAAGQQPGVLHAPLAQDREIAEHGFQIARHAVAVAPGVGAHHQVVVHRQQREHLAPFRHVAQALLHDQRGVARGDVLARELDRATRRIEDARDGLEDGRLACAVAAQHGGDLSLAHLQAHAADGLDRAVRAFDVGQAQDAGRGVHAVLALRRLARSWVEPR
jgi:hypothetical protein